MNISIITVTLNDNEGLLKTANSLFIQNNKSFEWIIKDGGAGTYFEKNIRSKCKLHNVRVRYLKCSDSSHFDAMHQALEYATGNYVLFLNSGDYLFENDTINRVSEVVSLEKCDYHFIYGNNYDKTPEGKLIHKKARKLDYLHHSMPISHQAIFYQTQLFKRYKYPFHIYPVLADYALTASIFFDGNQNYLKLNFPICIFEIGGLSTQRRDLLLKEGYQIHRKIVKNNTLIASYKVVQRWFTFFILDHFPGMYDTMRRKMDSRG